MARRYREPDEDGVDGIFWTTVVAIFLYVLWLASQYHTDRNNFWHWLLYGITAVAVLAIGMLLFVWAKKRHELRVLALVQKEGLEEQIKNFIYRFGHEKSKDPLEHRGHTIDRDRINELRESFSQKGVHLRENDFDTLLRHYIDDIEKSVTLNSSTAPTRDLGALSGSDFELLLQRLYEKMGYTVQLIGGTGDQGGDLIANNSRERLLIQAKRWNAHVPNAAVQQAVAARTFHDCNKAAVVAASEFTREAVELAKATNIELISKSRLQQLLIEHLSESWR